MALGDKSGEIEIHVSGNSVSSSVNQGQSLAIELWEYLMSLGFQACYFNAEFQDPRSARMLQMDGVFVRP